MLHLRSSPPCTHIHMQRGGLYFLWSSLACFVRGVAFFPQSLQNLRSWRMAHLASCWSFGSKPNFHLPWAFLLALACYLCLCKLVLPFHNFVCRKSWPGPQTKTLSSLIICLAIKRSLFSHKNSATSLGHHRVHLWHTCLFFAYSVHCHSVVLPTKNISCNGFILRSELVKIFYRCWKSYSCIVDPIVCVVTGRSQGIFLFRCGKQRRSKCPFQTPVVSSNLHVVFSVCSLLGSGVYVPATSGSGSYLYTLT